VSWQIANPIGLLLPECVTEPVEIEVVAYGPGMAFLKKDGVDAADIQKLESSHVHFIACGNAIRKQHLEARDLVAGSEVGAAGIVEVVNK
jgi:intracellular sulfur oxidation DsrE/DsrF family protein